MLSNILTCMGTGTIGVGVGLVINTIRNRTSKKRKSQDITASSEPEAQEPPAKQVAKQTSRGNKPTPMMLRVMYGLESYMTTIDKYSSQNSKDERHARDSLYKYVDRILELSERHNQVSTKRRYWNPAGAIAANATKVKLWLRTIEHMLKARLGDNLPEELTEALHYLVEYVNAEQYNKLLDH